MDGKRFLHSIRLQNILSFGPDTPELPLEPLNVLIGPNASGKSNLIEALSLLAAAPRDLQTPIREGGGVREWAWKGVRQLGTATICATLDYPTGRMPLRYRLSFSESASRFDLRDEALENERPFADNPDPYFYYRYQDGRPALNVVTEAEASRFDQIFETEPRFERSLRREDVEPDQSILSQRRDPDSYPELTYVATRFERMRFYREWNLGRFTPPRIAQKADLPNNALLEDASNLGLVLSDLLNRPALKRLMVSRLRTFYSDVKDIVVNTTSGVVQVFFHEAGLHHSVPATRLSDGTLRYLCLLTVLCHPNPPPVVCLEEPELGLHPDIIPEVAKLLLEASSRTQLFVTTHSDILVNALSEAPEVVIVCEKLDGATQLHRLDAQDLEPWLERYRLGDLWIRGDLGGNTLVSVRLYVEGGGDRNSKIACREAFRSFVRKAGADRRMPRVVASGSRNEAYDDFRSALVRRNETAMLLVDAEAPVTARDPWTHLNTRDGWTRPSGATNDQCHLMVQVMESWLLADLLAIQAFYGNGFRPQALPGNPNIEQIPKQDVLNGLERAAQATRARGYSKGRHSFAILASLDPAKVTAASSHAERFIQSLLALA